MTTTKAPIDQIRDGALKAAIWLNQSEKGNYYSVTVTRTYRSGETFKDSSSFTGTENLRAAELHRKAYDRVLELRAQERAARANGSANIQ